MKKLLLSITICWLTQFANSQNFSLTATRPYLGTTATGDYSIFSNSASSLSQIDKPIIIVEGFDNKNEYNEYITNSIYSIPKTNYLSSQLRDQGYDIIILNFTDHGDYIQRNAFLLEELINKVNITKQGSEKLIVMGHSSGAIIARYALAFMEQNNLSHNTKLYVSIDGANKGLNVPPTYQYLIKNFGGSAAAAPAMSLLFGIGGKMFDQLVERNTNDGEIISPTLGLQVFSMN